MQSEQAHIDRAYARLDDLRESARSRRDEVIATDRGGTHQAREERDVIVRASLARMEQLKIGEEPLCFGRIDEREGDRFYIARLGVSDVDQEPLVVDWRAPIAEPFYRATGRHQMGLVRRRHFITHGRAIVGIEDELLDVDAADKANLSGEGALFAALERSRTGTMRDIVATIQGEQDEIIRAPLPVTMVVQGGPGTGKTAVALHRAAYLLYTHRFPLEMQGVLVVGPNPLFLRYIEHVLPSLGETGVTLSTVAGLYGLRPHGVDSPAAARVKGDIRMRKVIANAIAGRQRPIPRPVEVPFGAYTLRLTRRASAEVVAAAKRRSGAHNSRRPYVEKLLARRLYRQYERAIDRGVRTGVGAANLIEPEAFAREILAAEPVKEALQRMWPRLRPEELLHDLFGASPLIELAGRGVLDADEQERLARPRSTRFEDVPWTAADIALLDEALPLLGHVKRPRHDSGPIQAYGHVVVDETQDLTPMQLRMIGRRSLSGSMTLVGDIGQATGPLSPGSWGDILTHLPARQDTRLVELSVNYRTPSEIMDVAARVLAVAAPHLTPPTSVRSTGHGPEVRTVEPGAGVLAAAMAEASVLRQITDDGLIAVIVPASMAAETGDASDLDQPITVVPVDTVKGLEFDGVVVVEPSAIAEESEQGLRALYVALTRATKRLTVVHERPLPDVLGIG
ncbi:MAG: HelD family protein [Acidimicrobiales bacterium]